MPEYLTQLRQILAERFNEEELRTFCSDLEVDYDDLPAQGKTNKARELAAYLDRRDRIPDLLEMGRRSRPDVGWAQVYLDDRMTDLRDRRDQADQIRREWRERQRVINLRPLDVTDAFKDRVRETRELCVHLSEGGVRLVSIVGRGGMGKTALVSRVLADLEGGTLSVPGAELKVDGILYLSARSTGLSLERIYTDVGRMLGEPIASQLATRWASRDMPLVAKVEYLLETMQDGLYIILLDNLEDNLAEDGSIAEEGLRLFVECCLTQPGGIRLIATSREEIRLAAAALHGARCVPLREGLPENEAVALLRDLDPQGTLGLRDAPDGELRRAAQLTRGIPRALEILAGILGQDPSASLTRLLANENLFGEQVVEKLVASGYDRLGENEQRVMEALAVFDQPVEETAIAYLLHPWYPNLDVRGSLRRLVSGYFVSANRVTGEYGLHPLDRDHAYRRLPEGQKPGVYHRRNLELRAAEFYARLRKPESEWKAIDDLAPQLAEFEHRVRAGDYDGACKLLEVIDFDYLFLWGYYARLVEMRERLKDRIVDQHLQIANLGPLGRAYHVMGRSKQAIGLYKQAVLIALRIKDDRSLSYWLSNMGNAWQSLGKLRVAAKLQKKALALARQINYRESEELCLGRLGTICIATGDFRAAMELLEQAVQIAREIEDNRYENVWLGHLATSYNKLGEPQRAIEYHRQSLAIARAIGDRRWQGVQLGGLGIAWGASGDFEQAIEFHQKALTVAREIGARSEESTHRGNIGCAYLGTVLWRIFATRTLTSDLACPASGRSQPADGEMAFANR